MFNCARGHRPEGAPRPSPDCTFARHPAAVHPQSRFQKLPRGISRAKDMHYFLRDARSSACAFTSISLKSLKTLPRLQAAMDSTET
jgi:hypothetical protein